VTLVQSTDYPWNDTVRIRVNLDHPAGFRLCLRIPGWVNGQPLPSDLYRYQDPTPGLWSVTVNGKKAASEVRDGYAVLNRSWKPGDEVVLTLPMPVRRVVGNPRIEATRGLVALERGPVVYCLEGVDNGGKVQNAVLPDSARVRAVSRPDTLGGVAVLEITGAQRVEKGGPEPAKAGPAELLAVPYAVWNNRGPGAMTVWLAADPAHARNDF